MPLTDSHCHLSATDFAADLPGVLARMEAAGVERALTVCVTLADFERVRALIEAHPALLGSVGVHPDTPPENPPGDEPSVQQLIALAAHAKVVAIGETGLDYFRLAEPLEWQRARFRTHLRAARACGKPLIIHTRSAAADTLRLMREEGAEAAGGVMHCFTETWDVARAALDLGFYISFSGIVTFKNAVELREVARRVPLDRLLVETDAPYLAPVPHRGKTNEPAFVPHTAACVAQLHGLDPIDLAERTTENFRRLFKA